MPRLLAGFDGSWLRVLGFGDEGELPVLGDSNRFHVQHSCHGPANAESLDALVAVLTTSHHLAHHTRLHHLGLKGDEGQFVDCQLFALV